MKIQEIANCLNVEEEIKEVLLSSNDVFMASSINDLYEFSRNQNGKDYYRVFYDIPGKGIVHEARVCNVKNGISANYEDPYMRRRDPKCMLIADDNPTDKVHFKDKYNTSFDTLRQETFSWLKEQDLIAFLFNAGQVDPPLYSLAIVPQNAAFFAYAASLLQGVIDPSTISCEVSIKSVLFVAPPFRFTHFDGKQMVVHNRTETCHEIFSFNLYPGPSAKKGVYSALINYGEKEHWPTLHASGVQVVTPYDNKLNILHEGASGGGKSEMNEHFHREYDGSILFGTHTVTDENIHLILPKACDLRPICDDMAIASNSIQKNNGKLTVQDAEHSWFIRVDHIKNYGTDPDIEARCIHPDSPLLFLNIDVPPGGSALLWEHIEDAPGVPCPNPRFILPRFIVPNIVNKPVSIDIRSFGVRTPPCTKKKPTYGILGMFHILPPALAWLWRLVSPRGFANPSIIGEKGMQSEGVGSYWPFATGKRVTQANILLEQFINNPRVQYTLCPIKHIGAWSVGFMPQWIMREYLARRGGVHFEKHELVASRSNLLGYSLKGITVEGQQFEKPFFQVDKQEAVGGKAFDKGDKILYEFFKNELSKFTMKDLSAKGQKIIQCFLDKGTLFDYISLIESESVFRED
jgi:hypothetical protein